jgi:putative colanic acid biosynthesis UDP-glucose lipid carrier transferase
MTKTDNELPLLSFFERLLDPFIITSALYMITLISHEQFNGFYLVLMIIAFFISSFVYEQVDPARSWRSGRLLAYCRDIFTGWLSIVAILLFIAYASGLSHQFSLKVIALWFTLTPFALLVSHLAMHKISSNLHKDDELRTVVIVGASEAGVKLAARIKEHDNLQMALSGYFEDRLESRNPVEIEAPLLGKMEHVAAYVREHNIKILFISLPMSAQPRIHKLLDDLQDTTTSIYFLPDIYTFDLMQARFDNIAGVPVVAICESPFIGINSLVKRASDIVLASLIQLLLTPLMLSIALAVKLSSPGPVIFKQRRYGLYGEQIIVYKFRSMTACDDGANVVQAKKDDMRVTRVGKFLRSSSLDELPQFINVLQGRMSIVGPRPHAVAHNELYRKLIKGYMLRHKVRPGITGWAQVNGLRGETDTLDKMKDRIEFDLDYVRKWSLSLDLWIILRTVTVVLKRQNAH